MNCGSLAEEWFPGKPCALQCVVQHGPSPGWQTAGVPGSRKDSSEVGKGSILEVGGWDAWAPVTYPIAISGSPQPKGSHWACSQGSVFDASPSFYRGDWFRKEQTLPDVSLRITAFLEKECLLKIICPISSVGMRTLSFRAGKELLLLLIFLLFLIFIRIQLKWLMYNHLHLHVI